MRSILSSCCCRIECDPGTRKLQVTAPRKSSESDLLDKAKRLNNRELLKHTYIMYAYPFSSLFFLFPIAYFSIYVGFQKKYIYYILLLFRSLCDRCSNIRLHMYEHFIQIMYCTDLDYLLFSCNHESIFIISPKVANCSKIVRQINS